MGMHKPPLPSRSHGHGTSVAKCDDGRRTQRLWQYLRAGRLSGLKFRRQHPIPPYVADFFCDALKLVIEIDGSQHATEADAARTQTLESHGFTVLRF